MHCVKGNSLTNRLKAADVERMNKKNSAAWGKVARAAVPNFVMPSITVMQRGEPIKRSKHGARKTYYDGQWFDSQLEARCYRDLKLREKAGEIRNLRRQVVFSLFMAGGEHYGTYKADFVYDEYKADDSMDEWSRIVADSKSEHSAKFDKWQKVKKLMRACHGIDVKELP